MLAPIAKCRIKPILECVLLDATPERVALTANNMEMSAVVVARNCEVTESVKTLIRADKLFRFASNYPKSNVSISPNGTKAIVATESAKLSLPTEDPKDFPVRLQPKDRPIKVPSSAIVAGCRVAFAADKGESSARYALSGVAICIHKKQLYMVATDGHIIAVQKLCEADCEDAVYVIPLPTIPVLQSLGDCECEITVANNAIGFSSECLELAAALFEGRYPRWSEVVLRDPEATAHVNREALIQELRPLSLLQVDDAVTACKVVFADGSISLSAETELGKYDASLPCELHGSGVFTCNPQLFLNCAQSFPSACAISIKYSKSAGAIRLESDQLGYYAHFMGLNDV